MTDLFVYGTLRHIPLLETVLGRAADGLTLLETHMPDHTVSWVPGQSFAVIQPVPGAQAKGLLIQGLNAADLRRIDHYEGAFGFEPMDVTVTLKGKNVTAQTYSPAEANLDAGAPWSPWFLSDWVAHWGKISVYTAQEVMAYAGRMTGAEVGRSLPAIRQRAASRISAQARPRDPDYDMASDVVVVNHQHRCLNWFGLTGSDLKYRQFDGSMGPVVNRGGLWQGEASVVLPYDPVRDTVLLVQQFRTPVYLIGDPAPWMWEAVAGMVDPGETPQDAAYREAREEANLTLSRLEPAGGAYASSGSSTEFLHLFVGLTELTETGTIAGLDTEHEDIRSKILPFDELMDLVDRHVLKDLPSLSIANWLARHRDRLRNSA